MNSSNFNATNFYDVIVVGGGPAGATAAYFLGEAGWRVLILEKENLPRYKPCGGGLSIQMLEETFPFTFEPVIESRVNTISYVLGNRTVNIPVADRAIATVMRDKFDSYLLDHVRAEVKQGVTVRKITETTDRVIVETTTGDVFESRYIIGADGAKSVVARDLKLRRGRTAAAAIEAEVRASPEMQQRLGSALLFIFGDVRFGYAWIFPKADHLSVGVAALHPQHGELQSALARVMGRYGISVDGAQMRGHPIPIYTRVEPISTARALLVGDAAGLADPFTGEGIRLAIKSGRLAAQAILSNDVLQYPATIYREIGQCHAMGLMVAWFFYEFPELCFVLGAPNPFITRAFVDMLADQTDYPHVLLRIAVSMPLYLIVESFATLVGIIGGWKQRERVRATLLHGSR